MPRVTHCTEDQHWGQVGSAKKIHVAKSFTQKGGFASVDKILERSENQYWRFEVGDFQSWQLGFTKFSAEWRTTEIAQGKVLIEYTYTLHSDFPFLYPLNWLFGKIFWRAYMKHVLAIVRRLTEAREPYLFP